METTELVCKCGHVYDSLIYGNICPKCHTQNNEVDLEEIWEEAVEEHYGHDEDDDCWDDDNDCYWDEDDDEYAASVVYDDEDDEDDRDPEDNGEPDEAYAENPNDIFGGGWTV